MRRAGGRGRRVTSAGRLLPSAALLLAAPLLAGCGDDPVPTTVESDSYTCTETALARLDELRSTLADAVPALQGRPRTTDYCDGGMDAGVEFEIRGELDAVAADVAEALSCDRPTIEKVALGRQLVHRCETGDLLVEVALTQYLPAGDPKGPSVLGQAHLLDPAS